MKKFGLFIVGLIALFLLLANVGPLISLAICLAILYFGFKQFMKSESTGAKVAWGSVSIIVLIVSISHIPAILGLVAAYVLYLVYKKWNENDESASSNENDPFSNFEREWKELNKN
ncbi:flagellar basal body rod protein [Peribacillus sp. NJ4]|uniref:lmo0954 family membrane protein n=1 Tax=Peribacillus TaxID=2675229 RepID=UPI0025A0A356|nr:MULTISPECIES: flagellar basal body rod protein [unclassified Peribacillus]MDM5211120.1 flagellar basal body rod protein [Peribacillus sp. NJ4]MDM5221431.1 flagellar basal body rod protein [Peribacillus sp. NJ11]MDM5360300.1 flagellar basal body rod protein [Peribacillus sp. ACCC06369]